MHNKRAVRLWYTTIAIIALLTTIYLFINYDYNFKSYTNTKTMKMKTILLWTQFFGIADFNFGFGQQPFVKHKCKVTNCYVTNKRNMLPIERFDAIVFHGAEYRYKKYDYPTKRRKSQIYAFFTMEPPAYSTIDDSLNGVFNMTITHRLDSDIAMPYFYFFNANEKLVSPSNEPVWIAPKENLQNVLQFTEIYKRKSKPVAWFTSNCHSTSKREQWVYELQKHISVDIYGGCGALRCPRSNNKVCLEMLKKDYYFYLAFENSLCEDYVTEKALKAYRNEIVPVIYSGANLTKFFPPASYIDANNHSPKNLAKIMLHLIDNEEEYIKYFWWKDYYITTEDRDNTISPFCKLCEKLNDESLPHKTYDKIAQWWHGTKDKPLCQL